MRLAVLLLFATSLFAQSEIAPGIRLVRGNFVPGTQRDGNSVLFAVDGGYVVVDTGRHVEHTREVLKFPVVAVVNTHWHLDHIGGNALVHREVPAAKFYASDALTAAREGFLANYRGQLENVIADEKTSEADRAKYRGEITLIDTSAKLAPDVVIREGGPMTIGGRDFYVGLEKDAVTGGDVWLLDKTSGVLVAGDLVTLPAPFLDTACPQRWSESLARLAKTDFELLVPGHGPPLTRRQFNTYRAAFDALLACKEEKAACIDRWVTGISPLIPKEEQAFTRMLMDYYVDVLRRPKPSCS